MYALFRERVDRNTPTITTILACTHSTEGQILCMYTIDTIFLITDRCRKHSPTCEMPIIIAQDGCNQNCCLTRDFFAHLFHQKRALKRPAVRLWVRVRGGNLKANSGAQPARGLAGGGQRSTVRRRVRQQCRSTTATVGQQSYRAYCDCHHRPESADDTGTGTTTGAGPAARAASGHWTDAFSVSRLRSESPARRATRLGACGAEAAAAAAGPDDWQGARDNLSR
jgi:hypothetical protein